MPGYKDPPESGKFKKGDPRINRKGWPKNIDKVRELAQQIAHEAAKQNGAPIVVEGHIATNLEVVLRKLMADDPVKFLEWAFGKLPNAIDVKSDNKTDAKIVVEYANSDTDTPETS